MRFFRFVFMPAVFLFAFYSLLVYINREDHYDFRYGDENVWYQFHMPTLIGSMPNLRSKHEGDSDSIFY